MRTLRVGLIGLGKMGNNHFRVLKSLDGVELISVVEPSLNGNQQIDNVEVLKFIDQLPQKKIDYCVVSVPTVDHEQIGLQLAEFGIHALIEKPLAHNSEAARNIYNAFVKNGLIGAVGHIERYNPALQEARKRLSNGELGKVFQIATRRQNGFPPRIMDVGVVKDLATHDIDLTSWLAQKDYLWVSARTAFRSGREYEDLVSIVGELESQIITNHLVNWLSPFKERVVMVTGERGAFVCDTLTADLTFYSNGNQAESWEDIANFRGVSEGDIIRYSISKPEPLRVEHENFRDAVLGIESEIVTMEQGLRTVEVAEMALKASLTFPKN